MTDHSTNKDNANPLSKFFRQPQIYLRLPSKGRWWPKDSIEMPANGELPVFAMTARDELLLKTPDAVMNGQGTVDVIQSCIPAIRNAWVMPLVDLDSILIAIRQATYGNHMEFTNVCPHCKRKNDHALDLSVYTTRFVCPDYDQSLKFDTLEIYLKPNNFANFNQTSIENYEQQKLLSVVQDTSLPEEQKIAEFRRIFNNLVNITVEQVSASVAAVKVANSEVVDNPEFIKEFFANCNKDIWNTVKAKLQEYSDIQQKSKELTVTCEHEDCNKHYVTPIEFETSHFFA